MAEDTLLTDEQLDKKRKWAAVWDKFTTVLLILDFVSPLFILARIILYFIFKSAY